MFNFGKEAMPLQELLYIKEDIEADQNPDYIIVLLNKSSFTPVRRLVPYYELNEDQFVVNNTFKNSATFKLYDKIKMFSESSLLYLGYRIKNNLSNAPKIILDKFYIDNKSNEMEQELRDNQSELTYQNIIQKLDTDERIIFMVDLEKERLDQIKSIVKNSPVIDLTDVLTKLKSEKEIDPYYWKISNEKGHWVNEAHKVIGEELAKQVHQLLSNRKRVISIK